MSDPREAVRAVALPHPLRAHKHVSNVDPGNSIDDVLAETIERSGVDPRMLRHAVVMVADSIVPKDRWTYTYPKPGTQVIVRALPGSVASSRPLP